MNVNEECPACSGKILVDEHIESYYCPTCGWCFDRKMREVLKSTDRATNTFHQTSWDTYFYIICCATAVRSKCLSRRLGVVIVDPRSNTILATGYNGPARGIPQCGPERMRKDHVARNLLEVAAEPVLGDISDCPRHRLGYSSSDHLDLCPAVHAERNALYNAARLGVSVDGSILYTSDIIPCSGCFSALIQAGIFGVVCSAPEHYDRLSRYITENSEVKIRKYELSKNKMVTIWETIANLK